MIDEVPKFLALVPRRPCPYKVVISTVATHTIIIPFQLSGVISYFDVRKPVPEECEDSDVLKIKLMMKAQPWDPSSPKFSQMEQSMLNYRQWFVAPVNPAKGQLSIKFVISHACNVAYVVDHNNFASPLEIYVIILSLQIAQVHNKKMPVLDRLILAKKWCILSKKDIKKVSYHAERPGLMIVT